MNVVPFHQAEITPEVEAAAQSAFLQNKDSDRYSSHFQPTNLVEWRELHIALTEDVRALHEIFASDREGAVPLLELLQMAETRYDCVRSALVIAREALDALQSDLSGLERLQDDPTLYPLMLQMMFLHTGWRELVGMVDKTMGSAIKGILREELHNGRAAGQHETDLLGEKAKAEIKKRQEAVEKLAAMFGGALAGVRPDATQAS